MGLVGQDGGEADAGVVVDGDVKVFITGTACLAGAVSVDAMARFDDAGQTLDIEVDQVAGMLVFIANHRRRRIERTQPVHPRPAQDAADGSAAEAERMGDAPAVVAQPAQGKNLFCERRRGGAWRSVRARRSIAQTSGSGLTEAAHPLGGLRDRSSRPGRLHRPTSTELIGRVEALRRERWTGLRIAQATGLSRATVSRILRRLKLSRMRDLESPVVYPRYEHARPGDLLHLDIKRLVRIARPSHRVTGDRRDTVKGIGAEYVHVAIDDHSRIAFSAIYPDETRASVLHFLAAALAYYAGSASASRPYSPTTARCIAPTPSPLPANGSI